MELIACLDLLDVFDSPGWAPAPSPYLRKADIGVQTCHTEGLSLALLERMMAGLAIEDGVTGVLIPSQDEEALTNALRSVVCDSDRAERLGAAARRRAIDEFSIEAMSRFAVEQYRRVLEAR